MSIQQTVNTANEIINQARENGTLNKRMLAIGIEINQKYLEYLDELETADLHVENGVTVVVEGKKIKFSNPEDFSAWLAGQI